MAMTDHPGRWTSRDLLVYVGGDDHAECTVLNKLVTRRELHFRCTCGSEFIVSRVSKYEDALRNVGVRQ